MSELDHDHVEQTDARLLERSGQLAESIKGIRHSPERLAQIRQEVSLVAFELWMRHNDEQTVESN